MTELTSYTEGDAAEVALCKQVADVLHKHFPGYPWLVGMSSIQAGALVIDLPYKPPSLRQWGYLFHASNVGDEAQIMRAGGEWLERLSLARKAAAKWAEDIGMGTLDTSNVIEKSRA
jgi:hypothetical protein